MPTKYSGNGANSGNNLQATIIGTASSTGSAGGLIILQTSSPHYFSENDFVTVAFVGGTTEANTGPLGWWLIHVIDSTHIQLTIGRVDSTHAVAASNWQNAWTSGGIVSDVSFTPAAMVPSGADTVTSASVGVPFQALFDRSQFIAARMFAQSMQLIEFHPLAANNSAIGSVSLGSSPGDSSIAHTTLTFSPQAGDIVVVLQSVALQCSGTSLTSAVAQIYVNGASTGVNGGQFALETNFGVSASIVILQHTFAWYVVGSTSAPPGSIILSVQISSGALFSPTYGVALVFRRGGVA